MNQCPACGYKEYNPMSGYSNIFGGLERSNIQLLDAQMQAMQKNHVYLSDEEYDLIMDRREKERRIRKAQETEKEVWHPELEGEIATPKA